MSLRRDLKTELDAVFGPGTGDTPEARARESTRMFVRSIDQLAFDESRRATGRRLTAIEALESYGWDVLREVAFNGTALLAESPEAAGRALRERREELRLDIPAVARKAGLTPEIIKALEESKRQSIQKYERVASILGLDDRMISFRSNPAGNERVAIRLRQLVEEKVALSASAVVGLAEASWVAMTQMRLEETLGLASGPVIKPNSDYGSSGWPAFRIGYDLADRLRDELGLRNDPIESMRDFVEKRLKIVVVQTNLGDSIAGATVQTGNHRAIVANLAGANTNVFVRRATLAHEICHLLYDPQQHLRELRVDAYSDLESAPDALTDRVEQRANAFAVELLAPRVSVEALWRKAVTDDPLGDTINHFGISFTAARYRVWNAIDRREPVDSLTTKRYKPDASWEGREAYTLAYHPIHSLVEHPARAGRFSAVAVRAAQRNLLSWDTAAQWLLCSQTELRTKASEIIALYPDVAGG
jgi:Zn-dependent peptidase ImmA (M78 family)